MKLIHEINVHTNSYFSYAYLLQATPLFNAILRSPPLHIIFLFNFKVHFNVFRKTYSSILSLIVFILGSGFFLFMLSIPYSSLGKGHLDIIILPFIAILFFLASVLPFSYRISPCQFIIISILTYQEPHDVRAIEYLKTTVTFCPSCNFAFSLSHFPVQELT